MTKDTASDQKNQAISFPVDLVVGFANYRNNCGLIMALSLHFGILFHPLIIMTQDTELINYYKMHFLLADEIGFLAIWKATLLVAVLIGFPPPL